MTHRDVDHGQRATSDIVLIGGGGPGISASCARLFAQNHVRVAIAARNQNKPALTALEAC